MSELQNWEGGSSCAQVCYYMSTWKKSSRQDWGCLKDSSHKWVPLLLMSLFQVMGSRPRRIFKLELQVLDMSQGLPAAFTPCSHSFPKTLCSAKDHRKNKFFSGNHRGEELSTSASLPSRLEKAQAHLRWVKFLGVFWLIFHCGFLWRFYF